MTYIRCPHCGAKALNVATMCPQCRAPLSQNPMEAGPHGLAPCRRCGKFIERDAEVCPYCAYHVRRGRTVRRWVGAGLGIIIVGAAGVYGLLAAGGVGGVVDWFRNAAAPGPPPAVVPAEPESSGVALAPDSLASPPPAAAPIVAAPPVAPAPDPAPPRGTSERYARNWANVRSGRSTDSAVVAVLRPGDRVRVSDLLNGWWAVWSDTARVGYVATDLLSVSPTARDSLR